MSLTAANCVYTIGVATIFPSPRQLQGFSADDVFSTDPIAAGETMMGVDGILTAGFVFVPIPQNISFMGDSASNDVFEQWYIAEVANKTKYEANAVIILPAIGKKYTCPKGFLTTYPPTANAAKIIQPRRYAITWERVFPENI